MAAIAINYGINFCILALGSGQHLLYRLGSGLAHTVLHVRIFAIADLNRQNLCAIQPRQLKIKQHIIGLHMTWHSLQRRQRIKPCLHLSNMLPWCKRVISLPSVCVCVCVWSSVCDGNTYNRYKTAVSSQQLAGGSPTVSREHMWR